MPCKNKECSCNSCQNNINPKSNMMESLENTNTSFSIDKPDRQVVSFDRKEKLINASSITVAILLVAGISKYALK